MNTESSMKEKQAFLREQISLHGFSQEDFAAFLSVSRYDGTNIHNWTLDELKVKVVEYKKLHDGKAAPVPNEIAELPPDQPKFNFNYDPKQAYKDVKVTKDATVYMKIVVKDKANVIRSISDLFWLFEVLKEENPNIFFLLPPPMERIVDSKSNELKQSAFEKIELSLGHLLNYENVLQSTAFEKFLKANQEEFTSFRKKYVSKKSKLTLNFENFTYESMQKGDKTSFDGFDHEHEFPENIQAYLNSIKTTLEGSSQHWGKIEVYLQQLARITNDLSEVISSIGKQFSEALLMFQTQAAMFKHKNDPLIQILTQSKKFVLNWSENTLKESMVINNGFKQALELLKRRQVNLSNVSLLVFDEARSSKLFLQLIKNLCRKRENEGLP